MAEVDWRPLARLDTGLHDVLIAGADRARPAESFYFTVNSLLTARTRYRHCLQISRPLWCVVRCVVNIITHPTVTQPWPCSWSPRHCCCCGRDSATAPCSVIRPSRVCFHAGARTWTLDTLLQLPTDSERAVDITVIIGRCDR